MNDLLFVVHHVHHEVLDDWAGSSWAVHVSSCTPCTRHGRAAGCDWEWLNRVSVEWPPNDFSFSFEIHYVLVSVNYNHFVLFVHRRVGDCSATLIPVQYLICCSLVAAKSQCSYLLFVSWMFRQQEVCSSCFSSFKLSKMQRQYFLCSPILGCSDR